MADSKRSATRGAIGARRIRWQVDRVTDQELADDFAGAIDDLVELYLLRCHEVLGPAA